MCGMGGPLGGVSVSGGGGGGPYVANITPSTLIHYPVSLSNFTCLVTIILHLMVYVTIARVGV